MIDTQVNVQDLENEFYSKPYYLSYSALNKMLFSPKLFYNHYILKQKEDKIESYLIDGKVIHNLLLDDGRFDQNFVLLPSALPSGNTRFVIDKVYGILKAMDPQPANEYTLSDLSNEILETLKEINLHQSLKTDEQRIAKIITEETNSYFAFLKSKGNRDLIDEETLNRCKESVVFLKNNNTVNDLLGFTKSEFANAEVYNEIELNMDSSVLLRPFGLKGIVDNIYINYDEKTIFINDLKTTGKTIADFEETIAFYNYSMQAAIYKQLVSFKFRELINKEWTVVFNFIVIDKYNQVYCFKVSDDTMGIWQKDLFLKLNEAQWHYTNKKYILPYKFANSQIIL
jgi:hypothetical protein